MSSVTAYLVLYALLYAAFGVASPFMPRLLETRGLTQAEIGTTLAAALLVRLAAGPLIGRLADRSGRLRHVLGVCLAMAAAISVALAGAHGFMFILLLFLAQAAALAPTTTLADALAVNADPPRGKARPWQYGRIRGAASLAFVLGTLLAGQLIAPDNVALAIYASAAFLLAASAITLASAHAASRRSRPEATTRASFSQLRALLRNPAFRTIVMVAALVYGSHAMNDAFAVIRWTAAGLDPAAISWLWSEAVAAEVLVFALVGPALIDRLGPRGAAMLAAIAGLVRWTVLAFSSSFVVLLAIQPLHGLTFALLHLACMQVMARTVPPGLAATAQAAYAFGPAVVTASLTAASGWMYGSGPAPFLLMAGLCLVAIPVAWTGLYDHPMAPDGKP